MSGTDDTAHEPGSQPALEHVDAADYQAASDLLRALSAPLRLALVDLLVDTPRCVHELVDALGVSQPLVSQHLKTLRAAGLVDTRRRGREVVYHLVDHHVAHVARDILDHAREPAAGMTGGKPPDGNAQAPSSCPVRNV
jgi:ArsR family transcriptional regulator, zinc-responsive transcriptional repressor